MPEIDVQPGLFTRDPAPRLLTGRCRACDDRHFPAADFCPYCGSDDVAREPVGEVGTLHLHTVVNAAPPGYLGPVPYGFGLVDLPEGLRVVSRLVARDLRRLDRGMAMQLVVEPLYRDDEGNDVLSWAYRPADEVPT